MSDPHMIVITDATIELTLTGGVETPVPFSCQNISASIDPTANLQATKATWCAPAGQVPAATSFTLNVNYYQDWGAADSISQFLLDNDTAEADFVITGVQIDSGTDVEATGKVRLVAGAYGGAGGTPLESTVALPIQGKPTIGAPTVPLEDLGEYAGGEFDVDPDMATA